MSEIYRNSTQYVTLDIYGDQADATPTAICTHDTLAQELVVNGPETVNGAQRWTAELGLIHTQAIGPVLVQWDFTVNGIAAQKKEYFDVITPLVDLDDIRVELELGTDVTDAQLVQHERRVRRIIEAACGQKFHQTTETIYATGRGDTELWLPKRALVLTDVSDTRSMVPWAGYVIDNDGWSLKRTVGGYYYSTVTVTAPIYAPFQYGGPYPKWPANVMWALTGDFGWYTVPQPVEEAALVLLEQRMCNQSAYRDNYLSSMKAADWRFDIAADAYVGTGNVVADQLLQEYVVSGAAVI